MQIEALKQIIEWSPEAIQEYCKDISLSASQELTDLGFTLESSNYRTHHLFGAKLPDGMSLDALKSELSKQNIFVSFRGDYIRLSCHVFNTKEDFTKLINCIKSIT